MGHPVDVEVEDRLAGVGLPRSRVEVHHDASLEGIEMCLGEVDVGRELIAEARDGGTDSRDRDATSCEVGDCPEHDEVAEREEVLAMGSPTGFEDPVGDEGPHVPR